MGFMGSMFGGSERTKFIELFKEQIRIYLSKKFYLEGQQKDYYFGKSLIDDDFTVYSININKPVLSNAIEYAYSTVWKQYERRFFTSYGATRDLCINFSDSAFNIPVYSEDRLWYADNEEYHFRIGYMPENVLEKAIKENPERWALFLKYKNE